MAETHELFLKNVAYICVDLCSLDLHFKASRLPGKNEMTSGHYWKQNFKGKKDRDLQLVTYFILSCSLTKRRTDLSEGILRYQSSKFLPG